MGNTAFELPAEARATAPAPDSDFQLPQDARLNAQSQPFVLPGEAKQTDDALSNIDSKTAQQLADDNSFNGPALYAGLKNPNKVLSPEQVDKLVQVHDIQHNKSMSLGQVAGAVWNTITSIPSLAGDVGKLAGEVSLALPTRQELLAGSKVFKPDASDANEQYQADAARAALVSGLEHGTTKTANLVTGIGDSLNEAQTKAEAWFSKLIGAKPPEAAKDPKTRFFDAAARVDQQNKIAQGEGPVAEFMGTDAASVAKKGIEIDPELVQSLSNIEDPMMWAGSLSGLSATKVAGGFNVLNKAGQVVAKSVTRQAADAFIAKTTSVVKTVADSTAKAAEKVDMLKTGVLGMGVGALSKSAPAVAATLAAPAVVKNAAKAVSKVAGAIGNENFYGPLLDAASTAGKGALHAAPIGAVLSQGGDTAQERADILGSTMGFGAAGALAGEGWNASKQATFRAAQHVVAAHFEPGSLSPVSDFKLDTNPTLEAEHQQSLDTLKQTDPYDANLLNRARAAMAANGQEAYLVSPDFAKTIGLEGKEGAFPVKIDGQPTLVWVLNGDSVKSLTHEPGHFIDKFIATPEERAAIDKTTAGFQDQFNQHYLSQGGLTDAQRAAMTPESLQAELRAEVFSGLLDTADFKNVPPGLKKTAIGVLARTAERLGLYKGGVAEPGAANNVTRFGTKQSPLAAHVGQKVIDRWLSDPEVNKALNGLQGSITPEALDSMAAPEQPTAQAAEPAAPGLATAPPAELLEPTVKPGGAEPGAPLGLATVPPAELQVQDKAMFGNRPQAEPAFTLPEEATASVPPQEETPAAPAAPTVTAAEANASVPNLRGKGEADYKKFQGESRAPANARVREVQAAVEASKTLAPEQKQAVQTLLSNLRTPHDVVYNAAKNEAGSMDRAPRRADVEAARNNPELRDLASKLASIPLDARTLKNGDVQLQFWSGDKVLSNYETLANDPKAAPLIPYKNSAELAADLKAYTENQDNGYRGDGEKLNRPANPQGFIPDENPDYTPVKLSKEKTNFLNLLMGEDPPETARANKGTVPIQVRAKQIASMNDRAGIEVKPKKTYKDYPNVNISDYNPLRVEMQEAGVDTSKLTEAHEWVNAKEIKSATPRPDIKLSPTATDVTAAGFMPKREERQERLFDTGPEVKPKRKAFSDMTDSEQEAAYEEAEKYFAIGHGVRDGEEGEVNKHDRTWIYNQYSRSIEAVGADKTHGMAFSHEVADKTFKGRYDFEKNQVSVAFPARVRDRLDHEPTVDDIPTGVYNAIRHEFGDNVKMVAFMPGRGEAPASARDNPRMGLSDEDARRIVHSTLENGGATFDPRTGKFAGADEDSYVVSIYPERTKIVHGDPTKEQLADFLKANSDLLKQPGNSLGTWRNDGKTYVDVVVSTADRKLAEALGQRYNQKAIWDARKGEEIPTGGTGEPVKSKIPEHARLSQAQDELSGIAFMPSKEPRAVKTAAIRDEETGKVYEGSMHAFATLEALADKKGLKPDEMGNYPQEIALDAWNSHPNLTEGFTTNSGEFLNREQAFDRALELGQYHAGPEEDASLESQRFAKQQGEAQQFMPAEQKEMGFAKDETDKINPEEIRSAVSRKFRLADKLSKQVELRRKSGQQDTQVYRGDLLEASHADGYAQELQGELEQPRTVEELLKKHAWLQEQIDRAEATADTGSTEFDRSNYLSRVESLRGQLSAVERLMRRKAGDTAQQFMPANSGMPDLDKEDPWKDTDWSKYEVKPQKPAGEVPVRRRAISKANQAHSVGEPIKAVHFSGAGEGLKEVDPAFMKLNSTGASWEPNPKRSFFYVEGSEVGNDVKKFGNRAAYSATIDGKRIYDATGEDPLGFFKDWPAKANDKAIQKAGFDGVLMSAENGTRKIVMMYQKTPVDLIGTTDAEGKLRLDERVMTQFMPAKGVDLKDYIGKPLFVLTTDRMGVGQMEVGPVGAKEPMEIAGQGGRGFMHIYKDGGWAFADQGAARRFLTRVRQVAGDGDSAIAALTVLGANNHMNSPTGLVAYYQALKAAVDAGAVSKRKADAHIKEIFSRLGETKSKLVTDDNLALFQKIKTLGQFGDATRNKEFNFEAAKHLMERANQRTLPINWKDAQKLGIDVPSIARDIRDPGLHDLPTGSIVGLIEIPKDQTPEKTDFHFSYPWTVEGKAIGFLNDEHHISNLTSDQRIYQAPGQVGAQPLMTVMPKLDKMEQLSLQFMPAKGAKAEEVSLADSLRQKVRRARMITADDAVKALGAYPKYLNGVVNFLGDRREVLKEGKVSARDLAKAYAITVASQGSDSIRLSKLQESVPGFNPDKSFLSGDKIRPEEAAAWWLGTAEGKKALDNVDAGKYDAKDWEGLAKVRKAFGDDRIFYSGMLMKPGESTERPIYETDPSSRAVLRDEQGNPTATGRVRRLSMKEGEASMANLGEVLNNINAAKGDGPKLMEAVQQLRGIGPAKAPFISHILGFGGDLTLDAVEINYWLTGKGNIKHVAPAKKALVDAIKHEPGSLDILKDRIVKRLMEVREKSPEAKAIPEEAYLHVMHHWLWDKAKGSETTHEGVYKAAQQFMPARGTEVFSPADIKASRRATDWSQIKIGRRDDKQKALAE
jgi:hypothetical protein